MKRILYIILLVSTCGINGANAAPSSSEEMETAVAIAMDPVVKELHADNLAILMGLKQLHEDNLQIIAMAKKEKGKEKEKEKKKKGGHHGPT